VSRRLVRFRHVVDQGLTLDGHRERFADFGVIERFFRRIEHVVIDGSDRLDFSGPVRQHFLNLIDRHLSGLRADPVDFVRLIHIEDGGIRFNQRNGHFIEMDFVFVVIVRIFRQNELAAVLPLGQEKRTVGYDRRYIRRPIRFALNGRLVHGPVRIVSKNADKIRSRRVQFDFQRVIVQRLHADLVGADFSGVIFFAVDQIKQHVGVIGGRFFRQRPFPRIFKIVRRYGIPVAPFGVLAQLERVCFAVVGNRPVFGQSFHRFSGGDDSLGLGFGLGLALSLGALLEGELGPESELFLVQATSDAPTNAMAIAAVKIFLTFIKPSPPS